MIDKLIDKIMLEDGEPCSRTCAYHITHPCETCGRIAAKGKAELEKIPPLMGLSDEDRQAIIQIGNRLVFEPTEKDLKEAARPFNKR